MHRRRFFVGILGAGATAVLLIAALFSGAVGATPRGASISSVSASGAPQVQRALYHDVSSPLRGIKPLAPRKARQ